MYAVSVVEKLIRLIDQKSSAPGLTCIGEDSWVASDVSFSKLEHIPINLLCFAWQSERLQECTKSVRELHVVEVHEVYKSVHCCNILGIPRSQRLAYLRRRRHQSRYDLRFTKIFSNHGFAKTIRSRQQELRDISRLLAANESVLDEELYTLARWRSAKALSISLSRADSPFLVYS